MLRMWKETLVKIEVRANWLDIQKQVSRSPTYLNVCGVSNSYVSARFMAL